jgi:hypothetical protein
MELKIGKTKVIEIGFYAFLFLYALAIIVGANFSVIDDHILLSTLLSGGKWRLYIFPELGRFFPLNGYEYNILSNISVSPSFFYSYNAVQFIIFCFLMYKLLLDLLGGKWKLTSILVILAFIFTPGFTTAWFRLFVGERNVIFFLTVFIFTFLRFQSHQKIGYAIVGFVSANIALYYKEPVFLLIGGLGFFHLVFGWRNLNIKQKVFDVSLLFSALVFVLFYLFVVYFKRGGVLYGEFDINPLIAFIKNAFNYTLNDPFIILLLFPLYFYRIYLFIKRRELHYVFDSLLLVSVIYSLVFFLLNMFTYYYLLPVYAFAIPSVLYFWVNQKLYRQVLFKILLATTGFFLLFSSLPTAIHFISHYKNVANNYQKTLQFLTDYIHTEHKKGRKVSIFLDGVNRNESMEIYESFIKYLEFKGLQPSEFDFKTNEDDSGFLKFLGAYLSHNKTLARYTVFQQSSKSEIQKGDLIVLTPYTKQYISLDKREIKHLQSKYKLIFRTYSYAEVPYLSIKTLIKSIFRPYKNGLSKSRMMITENILGLPLDFYVFIAK